MSVAIAIAVGDSAGVSTLVIVLTARRTPGSLPETPPRLRRTAGDDRDAGQVLPDLRLVLERGEPREPSGSIVVVDRDGERDRQAGRGVDPLGPMTRPAESPAVWSARTTSATVVGDGVIVSSGSATRSNSGTAP
jgi:hypothetical protein